MTKETRIPDGWISVEDYMAFKKYRWQPEVYISSYPTGNETVPIYFGPEDDTEAVDRWSNSRGIKNT